MIVCVQCRKEMQCVKNGCGARFGEAHVYPGDRFRCLQCQSEVLVTNGRPIFDPEHTAQKEYIQMEET